MFIKINYIPYIDINKVWSSIPNNQVTIAQSDIEDIYQSELLVNFDKVDTIRLAKSYQGLKVEDDILYVIYLENNEKILIDSNEYKRLSKLLTIDSLIDLMNSSFGVPKDE